MATTTATMVSCDQIKVDKSTDLAPQVIRLSNFPTDYTYKDYTPSLVKYHQTQTEELVYFYDRTDSSLFCYNLSQPSSSLRNFKFPHRNTDTATTTKSSQQLVDYIVQSEDSIYILDNQNQLRLVDRNGEEIKRIDARPTLDYDYQVDCSYRFPAEIAANGRLYLYHFPTYKITSRTGENAKRYFSEHRVDLGISLSDKHAETTINFPETFQQQQNYYTFWPSRAINKDKIFYSYYPLEYVYIYDTETKTQTRKLISSRQNFEANTTLDLDYDNGNTGLIRNYTFANTRFNQILANEATNEIYRILLHKGTQEDPLINKYSLQKSWSLIIADGNRGYKVKREITFPEDSCDYRSVLAGKNGFLVSSINPRSDFALQHREKKMPYYVFQYYSTK